jgi:hypothetical protein
MAEKALILISDISGFTDFNTSTEIDHAAHIIAELLETMIKAEDMGFTLAEVEGDALLMYRKGDPPSRSVLVGQCQRIFDAFHRQRMVIERDTVCQCGACQGSSALTLKFVAHYGFIKEIQVDRFTKATGTEMIIAHRLMKNDVASHEYILLTEACCEAMGDGGEAHGLVWSKASQAYPAIGAVPYQCAILSNFRATIPRPEPRPRFTVVKGEDNLEIKINASVRDVYQTLINVDKRPDWLEGVDTINRDLTSERIGMQHNCIFHGFTLVNKSVFADYSSKHARYSEEVQVVELNLTLLAHYEMLADDEGGTRLLFNVNWLGASLPAEGKRGLMTGQATNFELLKTACETNPAD